MTRVSKRVAGLAVAATVAAMAAWPRARVVELTGLDRPRHRRPAPRNHVRRDAEHRRRQRPRPHRHGAVVLHHGLRARARLHQAAPELPDRAGRDLRCGLGRGHHAGPGHRDRGADDGQRRDHRRRQGVHLPHQAGRRLEHHAGAPGHVAGLPPRVQGVLQPGQPGRQPGVLHQHDRRPGRRTTTRRPRTSPTRRRTRRRRRTSRTSRTRTPSPASRRRTRRRSSSR